MHLPDKQPEQLTELACKLRSQLNDILKGLPPAGEPASVSRSEDIFAGQPESRLFLLQSGQLQCLHQGKLIYIVETGALVGLSGPLKLPLGNFVAEEPVTLLPYDFDRLLAHANRDGDSQKLWTHYLLTTAGFFHEGMAAEIRSHFQPAAGFLHFARGETIIQQGTEAECVYTLLEGSADAIHDGVKVGDVRAEEIFGAMAVFTRQKRSASVVATSECMVMAVPKDDFIDLIEHQPGICLGLIEEMAGKINELNRQILQLH